MRSRTLVSATAIGAGYSDAEEVPRRRPSDGDWTVLAVEPSFTKWWNPRTHTLVLSAVEVVVEGNLRGPQWHVSISTWASLTLQTVPTAANVEAVLRSFFGDLAPLAEEDNHVPNGKVRNFWLPCREADRGVACACKATEEPHVDGEMVWRDAKEEGAP